MSRRARTEQPDQPVTESVEQVVEPGMPEPDNPPTPPVVKAPPGVDPETKHHSFPGDRPGPFRPA